MNSREHTNVRRWKKTSMYNLQNAQSVIIVKTSGYSADQVPANETVLFTQVYPASRALDLKHDKLFFVIGEGTMLPLVDSNTCLELSFEGNQVYIIDAEIMRHRESVAIEKWNIQTKDGERKVSAGKVSLRLKTYSSGIDTELEKMYGDVSANDRPIVVKRDEGSRDKPKRKDSIQSSDKGAKKEKPKEKSRKIRKRRKIQRGHLPVEISTKLKPMMKKVLMGEQIQNRVFHLWNQKPTHLSIQR